jgi:hypothetical protein
MYLEVELASRPTKATRSGFTIRARPTIPACSACNAMAPRLISGRWKRNTKYDVTVQSLTTHPEIWSAEFWLNLQRLLTDRGLYAGVLDGRANSFTLDAVRRLGKV